jgi:hypothetical protein
MASNLFKNSTAIAIGTTDTTLYTTPVGKKSLLTQFDVVNTTASPINVDVYVYSSVLAAKVYLFKGVPIAAGYPLEVITNGKKIVLQSSDIIGVKSSVVSSANAIASYLEDVN